MHVLRAYRTPRYFGIAVVSALIAGALLGYLAKRTNAGWLADTLQTIGDIFTNLLQVVVIPLVFTAIVVGVNSLRRLGGTRVAARIGGKTLLWFATTSLIAVLIGIVIGLIVRPGAGVHVTPSAANASSVAGKTHGSWTTLVHDLVPDNFFAAFANGEILQVVFLAVLIGTASYALGEKAESFVRLNQSIFDIIQQVLRWVIMLAPLGVLGLIGHAFASYGNEFVKPLLALLITVYAGCLVILLGVYPLLLRFVGRVSPVAFFRKAWPTIEFAFVSRSSSATVPLSRQTVVDLGVEPGYAGFAVPLGSTTKMDGCAAVYPALASIFIANLFGIQLSVWQYVVIVLVAVFGALATAGTTGWFTMLTLTLGAIDLPPSVVATGVAIVYGIDPIMDMMRTATNVTGQMVVPTLVARGEDLLNDEKLRGPSGPPLLSPSEQPSKPEPATP